MGISVTILNILNELTPQNSIIMLAIGLFCISLNLLNKNKEK